MQIYLLANLEHNPYLNNLIQHLQIKNIQIQGGEYNYQSIFFLPQVLSFQSNQEKLDIFHIHDIHYFLQGKNQPQHPIFDNDILRRNLKFIIFISQIIILKILDIKVIWTVHEWDDKYSQGRQAIFTWWRWIISILFDGFIVHSQSLQTRLNQELNLHQTQKITVIYHGNYIDAYPNHTTPIQARKTLSIPNYKFVFLLFGNIYPSKGFIEAIHTFKQLDLDDSFLIIAGKPANHQIHHQIHQLTQNVTNIRYTPQIIPDAEIQNYMQASNCIILPYQIFTTSGVAILAMSFAKTCIAPDSGYFREILDKNGAFLFDPTNPQGLGLAMQQAMRNCRQLTTMGKYNLERVKIWNWEYVADATYQTYLRHRNLKSCKLISQLTPKLSTNSSKLH